MFSFIFNIIILLPIWFCILLPFTILFFVINKLCTGGCIRRENKKYQPKNLERSIMPKINRNFDVIIYGATGFTGK